MSPSLPDWWRWPAGCVLFVGLLFVLLRPDKVDERLVTVAASWAKRAAAKSVLNGPGDLLLAMTEAGQGKRVGLFELVPKLAYLGAFSANEMSASDQITLALKLDTAAPAFRARPLPIVDGARIKNDGILFPKHPEFCEEMLVEGSDPKGVQKWLSQPLREALLELPEVWVVVAQRTMTLTLYGPVDVERIERLVETADVLFAEHGAEGGPSLLLDEDEEEPEAPPPPPKKKKPSTDAPVAAKAKPKPAKSGGAAKKA